MQRGRTSLQELAASYVAEVYTVKPFMAENSSDLRTRITTIVTRWSVDGPPITLRPPNGQQDSYEMQRA